MAVRPKENVITRASYRFLWNNSKSLRKKNAVGSVIVLGVYLGGWPRFYWWGRNLLSLGTMVHIVGECAKTLAHRATCQVPAWHTRNKLRDLNSSIGWQQIRFFCREVVLVRILLFVYGAIVVNVDILNRYDPFHVCQLVTNIDFVKADNINVYILRNKCVHIRNIQYGLRPRYYMLV